MASLKRHKSRLHACITANPIFISVFLFFIHMYIAQIYKKLQDYLNGVATLPSSRFDFFMNIVLELYTYEKTHRNIALGQFFENKNKI